ncbi:MAG: endolytic transglycosylase MltG [Caulobacterales bacterium]
MRAEPARNGARFAPRRKKRRDAFGWFSLISSGVVTAVAIALVGALLFIIEASRPGPSRADTTIVVPRGASMTGIGAMLAEEGQIRAPILFRLAGAIYASDKPMQAGEYFIPAGSSLRNVVTMIADGRAVQHPITLPEGITSAMVVDILTKSDVLTGDAPPIPPEGAILTETFNVQRGMDRTALLAQMIDAQSALMEELWPRRAQGLPFSTPEEALILASIVEKETGVPEERPRVAAVFVNRLRRGMPLQSDPTIIYGVCRQFPDRCANGRLVDAQGNPRGIRASEIELHTGYNTYRIPALPPTAISNPGRASIEAVLNPPRTNDLYFVADGTGGHVFASTVADHNRNVARWRQIERERAAAPTASNR